MQMTSLYRQPTPTSLSLSPRSPLVLLPSPTSARRIHSLISHLHQRRPDLSARTNSEGEIGREEVREKGRAISTIPHRTGRRTRLRAEVLKSIMASTGNRLSHSRNRTSSRCIDFPWTLLRATLSLSLFGLSWVSPRGVYGRRNRDQKIVFRKTTERKNMPSMYIFKFLMIKLYYQKFMHVIIKCVISTDIFSALFYFIRKK